MLVMCILTNALINLSCEETVICTELVNYILEKYTEAPRLHKGSREQCTIADLHTKVIII